MLKEVIMKRVLVMCIMNLELFVFIRLCLYEVTIYAYHVEVCNVVN